jgi:hypothetical protein
MKNACRGKSHKEYSTVRRNSLPIAAVSGGGTWTSLEGYKITLLCIGQPTSRAGPLPRIGHRSTKRRQNDEPPQAFNREEDELNQETLHIVFKDS